MTQKEVASRLKRYGIQFRGIDKSLFGAWACAGTTNLDILQKLSRKEFDDEKLSPRKRRQLVMTRLVNFVERKFKKGS